MLTLKIKRNPKSHLFRRDQNQAPSWDNNSKHNHLDELKLLNETGRVVFQANCQTVANSPLSEYKDTIRAGAFRLKLYVELYRFWTIVHGVVDTKTLCGEGITEEQDFSKWIVHDRHKPREFTTPEDYSLAWSLGGIVMKNADLRCFTCHLTEHQYRPGDYLDGVLTEG